MSLKGKIIHCIKVKDNFGELEISNGNMYSYRQNVAKMKK